MTQEDLFEWAKQMNDKYGINEEQLMLPFVNNEISAEKNPKIKVLDEDDGYCD